jgi:uncharacterized protein
MFELRCMFMTVSESLISLFFLRRSDMRRKDREITDIADLINILEICKTCHIAMIDEGKPYIVPMSYGYEIVDDTLVLYFHSAKDGRKIEILHKNSDVCFEMCNEGESVNAETPCNSGYYFSSIIGYGEVIFLDNVGEKCKALTKMFQQQTGKKVDFNEQQANTVCVFKVISKDFNGKKKPKPEK